MLTIRRYLQFAFSLIIVLVSSISAQDKTDAIDNLIGYCADNGLFNGTILVAEEGKVLYKQAFGMANNETDTFLEPDHAFYLASVSKQFTAMAIMILQERGKLRYDDPLSKYFPEFPDYAKKVTIRHLLTHTSGVADHFRLGPAPKGFSNADALARLLAQKAPDFEPGAQFGYSNGGYMLLSMIVAKASGASFPAFMKKNIFDPLEMSATLVYDESEPAIEKRAFGYDMFGDLNDYDIFTTGAGGMYSTVEDLFKWDQALYTEKLVRQETLREAFRGATLNDGTELRYGFGWAVNSFGDNKFVSHSGGLVGFRTYLERDITNKRLIVVLTNKGSAAPLSEIITALRQILYDSNYELPKIPIALRIRHLIDQKGVERAVSDYDMLKRTQESGFDFGENQLNNLGYYYLQREEMDTAIAVFKLNVKAFPEAFNPYDSLGEAYMNNGQYDLAIFNYKRSLELNPENQNANVMLKKIDELVAKSNAY